MQEQYSLLLLLLRLLLSLQWLVAPLRQAQRGAATLVQHRGKCPLASHSPPTRLVVCSAITYASESPDILTIVMGWADEWPPL